MKIKKFRTGTAIALGLLFSLFLYECKKSAQPVSNT